MTPPSSFDWSGWLPVHAAAVEGAGLVALGAQRLATQCLGVGKVASALALAGLLQQRRPAGVLAFGVCGAYPPRHANGSDLAVGDLCVVGSDLLGDEGIATEAGFADLRQAGLGDVGPFVADVAATAALAAQCGARVVRGVTVSTCSGSDALSAILARRSGAFVETMEGAALALCCARFGVPFAQLRAVSNLCGDRARGGWDLPRAVAVAQRALRSLFER